MLELEDSLKLLQELNKKLNELGETLDICQLELQLQY